jgi:hypothetical protein
MIAGSRCELRSYAWAISTDLPPLGETRVRRVNRNRR